MTLQARGGKETSRTGGGVEDPSARCPPQHEHRHPGVRSNNQRESDEKPNSRVAGIRGRMAGARAYAQETPQPPVNYPSRYMGGPATLAKAPNGALVYDRVLKVGPEVFYLEKTVTEVTEGVWVIGGYALINCIVVERRKG